MDIQDVLRGMMATETPVYDCPCNAEGEMKEMSPGVFMIQFRHDDWCPVIHDSTEN